ncbi:MAG TPA: protein translocase subunit SecF [Armatimonadota bacterium]|jgi:preprotein translocase subunit SecF
MVRVWYLISAIVIAGGVVAWALLGLNLGIDFTGGSLYKFQTEQAVAGTSDQDSKVIGDVRAILGEMQVAHSQIQVAGNNLILIRSQITSHEAALEQADKILAALNEKMGPTAGKITLVGNELVGPVIGAQLKYNALLALIIGNLLILIFLTVRYEFRVATACIVALIHDVLVMIGGMAIARAEVNSEFIAAMLTIVGFSVTDSVVIFDRIRENKRLHRSADLETITNASLLQTMHRSINTVLVVLLTLFSLFFLGGSTIHPFVLALLIGMTTGMYSSIFIASPLVVSWDKWSLSRRRKSAAVAPSRQRLVVAGGSAPDTSGGEEQPTEGLSAEQAMRRAQNSAQEAKRAERRERRKSSSKGGKRRY